MTSVILIGSSGLLGYSTYELLSVNCPSFRYILVSRHPHPANKPLLSDDDLHICLDCHNVSLLSDLILRYQPDTIILSANCRLFPLLLDSLTLIEDNRLLSNFSPKIILVSTLGSESPNPAYSNTYRYIDSLALNCPYSVSILKPSMIYGHFSDKNISRMFRFIEKYRFFPSFSGFSIGYFQPVYFMDVARAVVILFSNDCCGVYNICGPECISYHSFFRSISSALGFKVFLIPVPFIELILRVFSPFSRSSFAFLEKLERLKEYKCFANSRVWSDFGLYPLSVSEGLALLAESLR